MIIIMKEVGIVVVVTTRRIGMRTLTEMDAKPLVLFPLPYKSVQRKKWASLPSDGSQLIMLRY